ncbi:hypothetical protein JCM16303_005740 [Sporobolomyces ruberrimus]
MTRTDSPAPTFPPYQLSALLSGHTDDVRSLASTSSSSSNLFSSSRDGTARSWTKEGTSSEWKEDGVWKEGHEGFINAVCCFDRIRDEGHTTSSERFLLTAGSDSLIQVYEVPPSSDASTSAPVKTLLGHAHNVCCLHADKKGKRIASGSWDMTARIWNSKTWECERVLVDHRAAVWDVNLLDGEDEETLCLTAAADNLVRLFDGIKVRYLFKGHAGPVRALSKVLPDEPSSKLFASASNDGTIRIWNYSTGDALTILNHEDFVYSLTSIPSIVGGGLASSGEDGLVKVWNESDGECDQAIEVPALSVWSLTTLPNGDLACGCSDKMIWIFTRDPDRRAGRDAVEMYETQLEATTRLRKKRNGKNETDEGRSDEASKKEAVPIVEDDPRVLETPGLEEGEIKLLKEKGVGSTPTVAYQWNGSTWEKLGEVVDPPPPSSAATGQASPSRQKNDKMSHEGREYDFVFQIDVSDDSPPIPFPYDLEDDVYEVAKRFVEEHKLPESYLEQIVEFVRSNVS